jgi:hypothetical protein
MLILVPIISIKQVITIGILGLSCNK